MTKLTAYTMGLVIGIAIGWTANSAFAADLALPKPHRAVVHAPRVAHYPPPAPATTPTAAPELCLETGKEPYPGQTLQHDETCPTKLRWVRQK
jgi:hypothetical protein